MNDESVGDADRHFYGRRVDPELHRNEKGTRQVEQNGGSPEENRGTTSTKSAVSDSLRSVMHDLAEISEYVSYLASSQLDTIKLSFRNALFGVFLGLVSLIAIGGLLVTGIVLLLTALGGALAALFDTHVWVGNFVAGALAIALGSVGVFLGHRQFAIAGQRRTVKKYEHRRSEQRARFDHDVADRAAAQRSRK